MLTTASTGPNALRAVAMAEFTAAESLTSSAMGSALPPAASMEAVVSRAPSSLRSATATAAPAAANNMAVSRPIPLPPPVTKPTRPSMFSAMDAPYSAAAARRRFFCFTLSP